MSRTAILTEALRVIAPRPAMRTIDWALENAFTESGQPYNDFAYPHLSAPGGPFDAFDCPQYFDIILQWGSRLGKTFGGQVAMLKQADCDPCPMMFASPDEKLAVEIIERTYSMIGHCPVLSHRLPPPNRRRQSKIDLRFNRVYVAWSRSVSTLADKAVRMGHAAEFDKWEHPSTSREADPSKLFDDRFKEFPTFKRWKEGTPQEKGTSRIERARLSSCNALFWVPCVKCWRYQTLHLGDEKQRPGGIVWDKNEVGKSDKELAARTARYVCAHCEAELLDEHRGQMMRLGVWVPEGCGVNDQEAKSAAQVWREPGREPWGGWRDAPWITGTPARDGREWGSQLSSFYALSLSWGGIAREFIGSKERPHELRNFVNQWKGETWEIKGRETTWEMLGKRIITETPRSIVPLWASILTCGIDRQGETTDRFPWVVDAWGPGMRCATIAYGQCFSFDELLPILLQQWRHADDKEPLKIGFTLFDTGYRPKGIHEFCLKAGQLGIAICASKGSNTALNCDYRTSILGKDTSNPGMTQYMIDTIQTQMWIENQLETKTSQDDNGYSLHKGSLLEHQDFLMQLLNDAAVQDLDRSNNLREKWERRDENIPNDYRDCRRNAYVACLAATRGGHILPRSSEPVKKKPILVGGGGRRPDGRPWITR